MWKEIVKEKTKNKYVGKTSNQPYFVIHYSREARPITQIIKWNWAMINSDSTLREFLQNAPYISFIGAPTIQGRTMHSYLSSEICIGSIVGNQNCRNFCVNIVNTDIFHWHYFCQKHIIFNQLLVSRLPFWSALNAYGNDFTSEEPKKHKAMMTEHKNAIRHQTSNAKCVKRKLIMAARIH